jgi:hypothetical protein
VQGTFAVSGIENSTDRAGNEQTLAYAGGCGCSMAPWPRAEITSNTWNDWVIRHSYMVVPMQALVGEFVATFKEFPPRQKPSSFSVDQIMETLQKPQDG